MKITRNNQKNQIRNILFDINEHSLDRCGVALTKCGFVGRPTYTRKNETTIYRIWFRIVSSYMRGSPAES